ncbi:peptidoglycan-binding protein [Acrocarpospora catenulata]|uniref:peptidoglycan-binding protein n=1 Tax=Acrocarpospora catenulata TaxID=2836182 RepID=UPI001BD92FBA|nr:peptidoglycan-binding protein [Acrocarpospora catenulata]
MTSRSGLFALAVAGAGVWFLVNRSAGSAGPTPPPSVATSTAEVVRTDVAERRLVNGTLGYAGSHELTAGRGGIVTWLPKAGTVLRRGMAAYELDGARALLMYGDRPAWRDLRLGVPDGADVLQLERNLVALGHGKGLTVDRHFSPATYYAVRRWQKAAKLTVTGEVPRGQVVFAPAAVRVSGSDVRLGGIAAPGQLLLHGTGQKPAVLVKLSPGDLPRIQVGDSVVVTLPDGSPGEGKVGSIDAVALAADGDGMSVAPVTITLSGKGKIRGFLDQAGVQVAIVAREREDVLAVPTTALLARPDRTYEVVVVQGATRRHVTVATGLFDESKGLAEVTGDLSPGMPVEVPGDGS